MSAMLAGRRLRQRQDLLSDYAGRLGIAIRRHQSAVALRAAKVDAELAYRARGAFLASMNHELRTPLNAITGFAGLLKQADEMGIGADQRAEYLDYILQSAELLLSHINTILEIADAESGGAKLAKRAFDICDVLEQVVDRQTEAGQGTVSFSVDAPQGLPPVDADPDKIATALDHLVEFLADPANGHTRFELTVRPGLAGASADYVYVAFEAKGRAVPQAEIDEAMRVFEQVHEGLDRGFDQRRLGLPIAKSYVELNQGKFRIKRIDDNRLLVRFALRVARYEHQQTRAQLIS